jgi:signal transduction histidine kinase/ActR/RegA family two-component response regulator
MPTSLPSHATLIRRLRDGSALFLAMMIGMWLLATLQPAAQDAQGVAWLAHERLHVRDVQGQEQAGDTAKRVSLPDSWMSQGLAFAGVGRYRSTFSVSPEVAASNATQMWALRSDHLCHVFEIHLNGQLLQTTLPRPGWLGPPLPELIEVPVGRLRAGVNTLSIDVHCASQGGLGTLALNSKAALKPGFMRHQLLNRDIAIGLNLIALTFSWFVLILWWLRRQEASSGLFGLLILVAATRNIRYFLTADLNLSVGVDSWLYFTAHVITACVHGWFVMALFDRRIRLFDRTLWGVLIGFPLIGLLALPFDPDLRHTRNILQGPLVMLMLPSLWIVWRQGTHMPQRAQIGLGLSWLTILIASLHDLITGRMFGDVDYVSWMPWAIPIAMPSFMVIVIDRIVQAFSEMERSKQELESMVAERTRELAAANAAKGHFLASASHDLRQPVAAIGLITDLLRSRVDDPALRSLTDRLTRAVNSMESLLKGLLDLSRLDSGTVDVQDKAVRLQDILDDIASHEIEAARHKGLRLTVRTTPAVVWSDPLLLEQILRNLVGNAIQHTQTGRVLVAARRRGSRWQVQVWDTGPGIPDSDLPRIFEAFVQLGNPGRTREHGLGLGLAIVQRASGLLTHPIEVRSRLGHGSCFCVSLPAVAPPVDEALPPLHEAKACDELAGTSVLVIEDDPAVQDALVGLLRDWGMKVAVGASLAWLRRLPQHDWELVISDNRLSDGTGRDVAQLLRRHQPDLPVLIITGDTSAQQLSELALSRLPVLHKPFRAEKLRAMIGETMARARQRDDSV